MVVHDSRQIALGLGLALLAGALVGPAPTAGLGVVVTTVLALRDPLHTMASQLAIEDLYATVRFLLLAAVVLPLLPDHDYGPYGALNPFTIGVVVVLIAGISFVGYV